MFRKIMREIVVFIFSSGLILYYFLIYCLFALFINLFMGTKTTKLLFLIQKNIDTVIVKVGVKIVERLEKVGVWY